MGHRWAVGSDTIQTRFVTHSPSREARVVSAREEAALTSLVIKDTRPGMRRQYLISLRPFFGLNLDELTVSDLNSMLLTMTNENTRLKCVIALKACVDRPAVKALRVPASVDSGAPTRQPRGNTSSSGPTCNTWLLRATAPWMPRTCSRAATPYLTWPESRTSKFGVRIPVATSICGWDAATQESSGTRTALFYPSG